MTHITSTQITVYLGAPVEHASEERFLASLRRDLERRGLAATIFANLIVGRGARQIDFVVLTEQRLTLIELKSLNPQLLLEGGPNGQWIQHLGHGEKRRIGNPYRQALQAVYQLSDHVHELSAQGLVTTGTGKFYRDVDTVVCLDPGIPAGSTIEPGLHVDVVSASTIVERLSTPGHRPPWTEDDVAGFVEGLGLYDLDDDSPHAQKVIAAHGELSEYRSGFRARLDRELAELVDIAVPSRPDSAGATSAREALIAALAASPEVVIQAPSGFGKTYLARHCALELTAQGALVVWAQCSDYVRGNLSRLLLRAAAPYSQLSATTLARDAQFVGLPAFVFLDGFNELQPELRDDLLDRLAAFRLRYPYCSVVITSTLDVGLDRAANVHLGLPTADERVSLLVANGSSAPEAISAAFTNPFELSIAASCEAELRAEAGAAELYGAYVHRLCPSEAVRVGLRRLALSMIDEMCGSLTLRRACDLLAAGGPHGLEPPAIDQVLASPLVCIEDSHLRLSHELLTRHLAAEELVRNASGADDLSSALDAPARHALGRSAIGVIDNPETRRVVLGNLADRATYVAGVRGKMGVRARAEVLDMLRGALADAAFQARSAQMTHVPDEASPVPTSWTEATERTANEEAMLSAAGELLIDDLLTGEIATLLDRTDERLADEIERLGWQSRQRCVSAVVGGLGFVTSAGGSPVAVHTIMSSRFRWFGDGRSALRVATTLLEDATGQSWCRFEVILELIKAADATGTELVGVLCDAAERAWGSLAYHVRLSVLETIHACAWRLDDEGRDRLAALVDNLPGVETNWAYSTLAVEALASLGALEHQPPTVADLAGQIRSLVLEPLPSEETAKAAQGVCASQWENQAIVGPWYEAITEELEPSERFELYLRAASFDDGWDPPAHALGQLLELAPSAQPADAAQMASIFLLRAGRPPKLSGMITDQIDAFGFSALGAGLLGVAIPPVSPDAPAHERAWNLTAQLLASLTNPAIEPGPIFRELKRDVPDEGLRALKHLRLMDWFDVRAGRKEPVLHQLIAAAPTEVTELLVWGLHHHASIVDDYPFGETLPGFITHSIATVGDPGLVEVLRPYLDDPVIAPDVVRAMEHLNGGA